MSLDKTACRHELNCKKTLTSEEFKALMSSLHGGSLQTLVLYNRSILTHDWNCVYLPKLKRLQLNIDIPDVYQHPDFFEWFSALSTARLPALEALLIIVELQIPTPDLLRFNLPPPTEIAKGLAPGLKQLMAAFPRLTCLRGSFADKDFDKSPGHESITMVIQLFGEDVGFS